MGGFLRGAKRLRWTLAVSFPCTAIRLESQEDHSRSRLSLNAAKRVAASILSRKANGEAIDSRRALLFSFSLSHWLKRSRYQSIARLVVASTLRRPR